MLCPGTVIIDVEIIKHVTLITGLYEQTPDIDEAFHNLPTTWKSIATGILEVTCKVCHTPNRSLGGLLFSLL